MSTTTRTTSDDRTVTDHPVTERRTTYCFSIESLVAQLTGSAPDHREVHRARVTNGGFEIRIDWNGQSPDLACFDVRLPDAVSVPDASAGSDAGGQASEPEERWAAVGNTDSGPRNDVLEPAETLAGKKFLLHVHRGPEHGDCGFAVKVVPVTGLPETLDADFVAIRHPAPGHNYQYEAGVSPALIDWCESSIEGDEGDGVQRATVVLEVGRDHELWVRLQSPIDPDHWLERDPIVRTGNGGGGQPTGNGESARSASPIATNAPENRDQR